MPLNNGTLNSGLNADKLDGYDADNLLIKFEGGDISSSVNTITKSKQTIKIANNTIDIAQSTANIINSLSISTLSSSNTTNLIAKITINNQNSSEVSINDLYARYLNGVELSGLFTSFTGGTISSNNNTLTQTNHSITIGGVTKSIGYSTANIINSLSVSSLLSSKSSNLSIKITVNGVESSEKILTDLYAKYDSLGNIIKDTYLTSQDHYKTSITAGTIGTSSATSGSTISIPYIIVNSNGHITNYGTHTHTITGFLTDQYYTHLYATTSSGTSNAIANDPYLKIFDDSTFRNSIQLKAGTNMTISSDSSGIVTFNSVNGVTSVATGTGLTGGTITSTGTISINSTYQTYISHGESAYNSLSNYLPLAGGEMTGSIITPQDDSKGIIPKTDNYGQIGSSTKYFYRGYFSKLYIKNKDDNYVILAGGGTKALSEFITSVDYTIWRDISSSVDYKIQVVSSLPSSTNANTFYIVV